MKVIGQAVLDINERTGVAVLDMNESDCCKRFLYINESDWTVLDINEREWSVLDINESDCASGSGYK